MVDHEEKLISTLKELKKTRNKNKELKEQLLRVEEGMYNYNNEYSNILKVKLEDDVNVNDNLVQ